MNPAYYLIRPSIRSPQPLPNLLGPESGARIHGRPGGTRTPNRRIWSPVLYQLSHWPLKTFFLKRLRRLLYSTTSVTTPAPTVRPPSRIAKRSSRSIAIGVISSTSSATLSPGITISRPSGSVTRPVTSVVRK